MKRAVIAVAALAALTGCARNPQLYAGLPVTLPADPQEIDEVLFKVQALRDSYMRGLKTSSEWADVGQLPLIGVAVASGVLAVNQPKNGGDTAAKLGIGVGAYAATRSIFAPPGMPDLYRRGVKATNCVLSEGPLFARRDSRENVEALSAAAQRLATELYAMPLYVNDIPLGNTSAADAETLKLVRANAALAVAAAEPILANAGVEIGAFKSAPRIFNQTAFVISDAISAKAVVRTEFDREAFAASIKALIPANKAKADDDKAKSAIAASGGARNAGDVSEAIRNAITRLNVAASETLLAMPAVRYSARLGEVVKCPASI